MADTTPLTEKPPGWTQPVCGLRLADSVCGRPEGHSAACYDEITRVTFEDGFWGDDMGHEGHVDPCDYCSHENSEHAEDGCRLCPCAVPQ